MKLSTPTTKTRSTLGLGLVLGGLAAALLCGCPGTLDDPGRFDAGAGGSGASTSASSSSSSSGTGGSSTGGSGGMGSGGDVGGMGGSGGG